MADFHYTEYPSKQFKIEIHGIPYSLQPKKPKSLDEWAKETGADIVYPLAMYNMVSGKDTYGPIYGRTLQFVRSATGDVGYGGSEHILGIRDGLVSTILGPNNAGACTFACAGYKEAIVSGAIVPGLNRTVRRSRNVNGISENGNYFHMLTEDGVTEYECAQYLLRKKARLALLQDGGCTTAKWENGLVVFAPEGGRSTCSVVCIKRIQSQGASEPYTYTAREYINGPNRAPVYETSAHLKQIGSLDPNETCMCLYEGDSFFVVLYTITGTNQKKVGFIRK